VINSNLGPIFHRFRVMANFPLKTHSSTPSIQPQIWKCFPCTASAKLCTQRVSIQDY